MTKSNLALKANWSNPMCRAGSLVKRMAAIMMAINGMAAFFTPLLMRINIPQAISTRITTFNKICAYGSPKRRKLLANSALINFIRPEVIKTNATAYLMSLIDETEV